MPAPTAEFRIKAAIDSTDAVTGGEKIVGMVGKIEGATKASAETMDASALGNLRSVHHLLTGLFELSRGGTAAVGGLAMEGRIATEVFAGMLGPLAPLAYAFTTITALAMPMLEKWQEHLTKIADAKDGTDALKEAASNYKDEIDAILESQKQVEESDKRQLEAIKGSGTAEAELIQVQKDAAIEKARSEYLAKLSPDMPEADRKKLKDQFDARKSDIEGASEVATANLAAKTKADEIAQQKKDLADVQTAMRSDQQRLNDAQDAGASGANFLALAGIKTDDKGNLTASDGSNAGEAQQEKIDETSQELQALKRQLESEAKTQAEHHDRPDADFQASQQRGAVEVRRLSDELDQQTLHLAQMRNAAQAVLDYKTAREKFGKAIENDSDKIGAQRDALDQAMRELNRLTQAAVLAGQKAVNKQTEHTITASAEEWQKNLKEFQKQRDERLQKQIDDLETLTINNPLNKADYDKQIAQLKTEGIANKAWDAAAEHNTDKAFFDLNKSEQSLELSKGAAQARVVTDTATKKSDEQQIDEIKLQIEATKSQPLIEAMKKIVIQDRDNLNKELADLVALFMDKQGVTNTDFQNSINELRTKMNRRSAP